MRGLLEANAAAPGVPYRVSHLLTEEGPVHDVAVPVLGGDLGTVRVGMTEAGARRAVAQATGRLLGMTVASLAASALLALLLIQEALTNVARHAEARTASVVVERRGDALVAIVEDDGRGFEPESAVASGESALGLFGMRERAAFIGGSLTIESRPGQGMTIYLRVPLPGGGGGGRSFVKKVRILLVDDHAVLRSGLRMLLEAPEDLEVIEEAGKEARQAVQEGER